MKTKLSLALAALLLASGCSDTAETENTSTGAAEEAPAAAEATTAASNSAYVPNPQVTDDRELVEAGQSTADGKGELELIRYSQEPVQASIGPVELTVNEAKIMHFVPDYSMIDFYHMYTHDVEFDFVKLNVAFENTADIPVQFNPVARLKTSTGELIDSESDFYLEELGGTLAPGQTKTGSLGFIVEKGQEITAVELLTSDAVDEQKSILEQGQNLSVSFN